MGFEDKGTFEIFTHIKNTTGKSFDEELTRDFAQSVCQDVVKEKIYIGWQDIGNEQKRMLADIKLFSADPKYLSLALYENEELLESLMKSIVQNYSLK